MNDLLAPQQILSFWFEEIEPVSWYRRNDDFDATIRERWSAVHAAATRGELEPWRETAAGRLAEILVLDQFSRNLYRDRAESYAWDGMALVLAQEAIRCGDATTLAPERRAFLYMPFMHSESLAIHERALELFSEPALENNLDFERRHRAILERFGRYPHRNAVLGRASSPEELAFLEEPGSSF